MYNQYLITKPSKNNGGTFTTVDIPAQTPILEFTGDILSKDKVSDPNLVLQIDHKTFIGPSGSVDDVIAHSCNPNCYLRIVGKRALLYSLYAIKANTELTFDWSTSSTETLNEWSMQCNCGSFNCRKVISGFQTLAPELQEEYKQKGIVPLFLTHNIFVK